MTMSPVSRIELVDQLQTLGVEPGAALLVHTSFRSIGPIEGGAEGLIQALLDAIGPQGTLVMPSWSGDRDELFDPVRSASAPDLGIVPDVFWRLPGVRRSLHPHAFAAVGPHAGLVLRDPLPLPPHSPRSPVGRVRDLDGQVLLLGVNHDANTTVHLAELEGDVPYRVPKHCTVAMDGTKVRIEYGENDHCCRRFVLVDDWLRREGLQKQGPVGHGTARLARSRDIVEVVMRELRRDRLTFLHGADERCADCEEARASVPG
jgi:aminoglycoside 3-N-acetyltransferase IV